MAAVKPIDWRSKKPTLSTSRVAGLLGVGWLAAERLQEDGVIPSVAVGVRSQKYWRTSPADLKAFLNGRRAAPACDGAGSNGGRGEEAAPPAGPADQGEHS